MPVEVIISGEAVEQFEALNAPERATVLNAIDRLAAWPKVSGVKALHGLDGFRVRAGRVRIIFDLRDGAPFVVKIARRDKAYEERRMHRQAPGS